MNFESLYFRCIGSQFKQQYSPSDETMNMVLSTVNIVLFDCSSPPTDTVKLNNMYLTHAHLHNVECETGIHSFCGHIQMHCMTSKVGIHIY